MTIAVTMRNRIDESKIVYDKRRKLARSVATEKGYLIIGIKDNPSKEDINTTIRHEFAHTRIHGKTRLFREKTYHERTSTELAVYKYEKRLTSPSDWNRILPTRIKDFIPYITWESEEEQRETKRLADKILAPKKDGGNLVAIKKASNKLSKEWLVQPSPKVTKKTNKIDTPSISRRTILKRRTPRIIPTRPRLRR